VRPHAYVTTADGSRNDARLHEAFTGQSDAADLPVITPDSRHAVYVLVRGSFFTFSSTDLQAPGTSTQLTSPAYGVRQPRVADATSVYLDLGSADGVAFPPSWYKALIPPAGQPAIPMVPFSLFTGLITGPREVEPAPDASAVVFDNGSWIYASVPSGLPGEPPGNIRFFDRVDSTAPRQRYAPDSRSAAVANAGQAGLFVINPKSGWGEVLVQPGDAGIGPACPAFAGQDEGC
jgi:hypothetical protein